MKITGFRIGLLSAGLRVPFRTALREVRRLEDVVVELQTSDGRTGRGEAPPTAAITGETLDSLIAALRDCICPKLRRILRSGICMLNTAGCLCIKCSAAEHRGWKLTSLLA